MLIEYLCKKEINRVRLIDFKKSDRFLLVLVLINWLLVSTLSAIAYNAYLFGFIVGGALTALSFIAYVYYSGTPLFRILVGIILMSFTVVSIQQNLGQIEMHFHVFVTLSFLTIYRDIKPLLIAALYIIMHHLLFTYLQLHGVTFNDVPVIIFNYACGYDLALIHIFYAVLEFSILYFVITRNQNDFYKSCVYEKQMVETNIQLKENLKYIHNMNEIFDKNIISSTTDLSGKITAVSQKFCEISGYKVSDLIGKTHAILRDPECPSAMYEDLWKTITENNTWNGNLKNIKKDGGFYWVNSTIAPTFDKSGIKSGYSSVRQDITAEKEVQELNNTLEHRVHVEVEKNIKNEKQLIEQSRMAQMGEMINMIGHQWRQPLNALGLTTQKLGFYNSRGVLDDEKIENIMNHSMELIDGMSTTIDDFRNFYKPSKELVTMRLDEVVNKSLTLIQGSMIDANIELIQEYNSTEEILLYGSELMQVILNVINNASDNFKEKQLENPHIKITTENRTISICDNAGGIAKNIMGKIFDPYFSTKNEKNGTGLGLYMSKTIVEDHHNGKLSAHNTDDGVCFIIEVGTVQQ